MSAMRKRRHSRTPLRPRWALRRQERKQSAKIDASVNKPTTMVVGVGEKWRLEMLKDKGVEWVDVSIGGVLNSVEQCVKNGLED